MTIMRKTHARVDVDGELVTLELMGLMFSFEFDLALKMAVALRIEARYAKRSVHDASYTIRLHGRLHNATPERVAPARWRAKIPAALKNRDIDIQQTGSTVAWRIGPHTLTIPYEDCFTLAQWLTVAGRAARDAAGEKEDWLKIANVGAAEARERNLN
jgi:hypothetical protein